jgi:1,2-diacylglycerol 3-beta-galactosyltransferase
MHTYNSVDKCFVPSSVLRQVAKDRGLRDDQIVQHGLPIRSGFWSVPSSSSSTSEKLKGRQRTKTTATTTATTTAMTTAAAAATAARNNKSMGSVKDDNLYLLPGRPNVLVVGGGDGMGGIVDIARELGMALAQSHTNCQLTVVCGKNQAARIELEQVEWPLPTQILGFVDNMDEWMHASTILVTKAGPGTIAEASICGLPCLMFSFL